MSRPWQETNRWYCVRYTLPVNEGGKPEIVALQAENESGARQRIVEHFTKKARNVFGEPTIVSVEAYDSWDSVKQSVNVGGVHGENN